MVTPLDASQNKLNTNILTRQELETITPTCNQKCISLCLFVQALILFTLGAPIILLSQSIKEVVVDYSNWYNNLNSALYQNTLTHQNPPQSNTVSCPLK
jgi:hypothetical protein